MSFRVIIHETARADIRRNSRWWAEHHSHDQAEKWFHHAFDAVEKLADFPESHPLAQENAEVSVTLRECHFGIGSRPSYRAVFVVKDEEVHVLTVRRAAQDRITPDELQADIDELI